ncbi:DUF3297 family protein [Acetobacter sp. AN02]|uniref:DUF3297 family protein n=1 Tax=Acetobacter sp. AN02 TaxID=2894186 RepID=UPI0024340E19|nr:DUF3297 family protein [Acetobacter sp. AN02]MDG6094116.1 DUF3297 family protein [Acetobacter sp. AN02]
MTDTPPDRLSVNPISPFFNNELLARGVGVRFKGVEKHNVEEYCISEGWVKVAVGKTLDRQGNPMTIRLSGPVEVWFKDDSPAS